MSEIEALKDFQAQPGQERKGWQGCLLGLGVIAGALVLFLCFLTGLSWIGANRARMVLHKERGVDSWLYIDIREALPIMTAPAGVCT